MPLTFGIPLGLMVAAAGLLMLFVTRWKRLAKVTISLGFVITFVTLCAIFLALNSSM